MSPNAYSYVRFSTPEQRKGDSLRRQTEFSERYVAEHRLVLDNTMKLQDLGVSAYSGEHRSDKSALGQFLKLVEEGKIEKGSVLLVETLDRLSRQEITIALKQFLDIINKDIKIVTMIDNREYTTETVNANPGELVVSLTSMVRAHEESDIKSKRGKETWVGKRKQIYTIKLTARCPAWLKLNKDKTHFDIIEDRKEIISRIFDMKLAGKGTTTIVRELNSAPGIWKPGNTNRRKQGEGWRESYVKKILQNRSVIGEFQPHRLVKGKREPLGDAIPDYFPIVIEKDIFYRVQEQLRQNNHKGGRTGKVSNLFSCIAKCGYCGSSMAIINKGPAPKGGQYLICDRARRKSINCSNATVRYDEFERLMLIHCKGLRPQDILAENDDTAIMLLTKELNGKTGELNSIIAEIENIADSISTTPDKRVRALLEERMSERFNKQDSLKREISQIEQQIHTLSRSFDETQLTLDSLKDLVVFLTTTNAEKLIEVRLKLRSELRKLIEQIKVYPEGNPRHTIESVGKALEVLSTTLHIDKNHKDYVRIKEDLQRRLESPKDFRRFEIFFASGSLRFITPKHDPQLTMDLDIEQGSMYDWYMRSDGIIVCEEYSGDFIRSKHYKKSIDVNGNEILQEILIDNDEGKNFQRIGTYCAAMKRRGHLNYI